MAELIHIGDPNLDAEELLDDILKYCMYLEEVDPVSTIEYSPKDGKHITSEKIIKKAKYDWQEKEYEITKLTVDDSKKNIVSKFYFGGEGDSNQTRYEQLLNNLKICTKSTNDKVGKILLSLLRIIIDNSGADYLISVLELMNEESPQYRVNRTINGKKILAGYFYLSEIVEYLSNNETFSMSHDIRDGLYVKVKLSSSKETTKIIRFIGDVDVWDLYRIGDGLGLDYTGKRYSKIKN